jgi:uncharacterized protein YbaP (TraB family)
MVLGTRPESTRMIVRVFLAILFAVGIAAPASAEPALWKVQGPHATVYLFGTVHILKSTTQWRTPKIEEAFTSAGSLWEEVPNADDVAAMQPLLMQLGLDPAHPLSSQLTDDGKAKLAAFEAAYGLPPQGIEMFRPWLAAMTFSVIPMTKAGYDPKSGVDTVLRTMARAQNKPMMGFETAEQQMHYLADLPQQTQLDYLLFTLGNAEQETGKLGDLVDAWAAGDTAKLEMLLNVGLAKQQPGLYRTLLADRNRAFATKIEQLLSGEGVTFVAVGAGHLVGPDSIQAALAKDGFQAVRQ